MTKFLFSAVLICILVMPVSALEITAPNVPESGAGIMPSETESFGQSMMELIQNALLRIRPDLKEAANASSLVITAVMLISILHACTGRSKIITDMVAAVSITGLLLRSTNSMIHLGAQTVQELSDYGKLLYPVMTAAMAAQGGVRASTALYIGTSIFDTLLANFISRGLLPMVYLFLALAVANCAAGEEILKKMSVLVKNTASWCLKTILIVFTTYMSVTGVVSGTTDAAALKATKLTISSVVPVVGGILSDASESVLISAGLMKNAAGIYGIVAILAVFLEPFLRIGVQYLFLKVICGICGVFASKNIAGLIEDFSAALGLMLAMTGSVCLLLLISTVCFMKGVG